MEKIFPFRQMVKLQTSEMSQIYGFNIYQDFYGRKHFQFIIYRVMINSKKQSKYDGDDDYVFYKDPKWKKRSNCNQGTWTNNEKNLFVNFLKNHQKIFQTSEVRRAMKSFQRLSKYIKKRSPAQCRSHYQKLEERYGKTVRQVIQGYEAENKDKQLKAQIKEQRFLEEHKKTDSKVGTQEIDEGQANKFGYTLRQISLEKNQFHIKLDISMFEQW